ncbi:hypothetical protein GCM10023206_25150 [Acinetobacter puyangensis]|uniref:A predicted alpha-helical domain with a conserved ER motif n=1 Tax=Acinetobacter puyangensis TaxID=1096779 RepID=A0A240E552_9GAMM|nr:alpha-E domain-containing protein [Acinetobacter puyangensis]SNX43716.1 A predicted alpha-helical domain with a conserved ER motif [Acinetobacter puyangensis]
MILLSSAAQNIFWLGRYLSRIQQACSLLPFQDDKEAIEYAHVFCLPAWDANSLNALFLDPEQPFSIAAQFHNVRDDIQQLRAVLSPQTYSELNRLTKILDDKAVSLCDVVNECAEVLEGEVEQVFLFYALGRAVEDLDHQCRLEQVTDTQLEEIEKILGLLKTYGWHACKDSWHSLRKEQNMAALYHFSDDLATMFEVCE